MNPIERPFFQAGGSLSPEIDSYIDRKADVELYDNIKAGNFCYVLTARQMGKSSLRVRVIEKLTKEEYGCVSIDITQLDTKNINAEKWYYSLIDLINTYLGIPLDASQWWQENEKLVPVYRFFKYIETEVLKNFLKPIVIFIDEIDSVISFDRREFSTDDFFASIRALYNKRSENPELRRLNFVVIGVASPNDLMEDATRTPFNIGQSINLENLSLTESKPLMKGFARLNCNAEKLLAAIYSWTNGQPVLTQRLCKTIADHEHDITDEESTVREYVNKLFIDAPLSDSENNNLLNVNNRILDNALYGMRMLMIYKDVLNGELIRSNTADHAQMYLRLSGLVYDLNGKLIVNNRIYETRFNEEWVNQSIAKLDRPFQANLMDWYYNKNAEAKLLSGKVLERAEKWAESREDVTQLERQFLTASRNKEIRRKARRQLIFLIIPIVVAVIAILSFFIVSLSSNRLAKLKKEQELAMDSLRTMRQRFKVSATVQLQNEQRLKRSEKRLDSINLVIKTVALSRASLEKNLRENKITLDEYMRETDLLNTEKEQLEIDRAELEDELERLNKEKIDITNLNSVIRDNLDWMKFFPIEQENRIAQEILEAPDSFRHQIISAYKEITYAYRDQEQHPTSAYNHYKKAIEIYPIQLSDTTLSGLLNSSLFFNDYLRLSENAIANNQNDLSSLYSPTLYSYKNQKLIKVDDQSFLVFTQNKLFRLSVIQKGKEGYKLERSKAFSVFRTNTVDSTFSDVAYFKGIIAAYNYQTNILYQIDYNNGNLLAEKELSKRISGLNPYNVRLFFLNDKEICFLDYTRATSVIIKLKDYMEEEHKFESPLFYYDDVSVSDDTKQMKQKKTDKSIGNITYREIIYSPLTTNFYGTIESSDSLIIWSATGKLISPKTITTSDRSYIFRSPANLTYDYQLTYFLSDIDFSIHVFNSRGKYVNSILYSSFNNSFLPTKAQIDNTSKIILSAGRVAGITETSYSITGLEETKTFNLGSFEAEFYDAYLSSEYFLILADNQLFLWNGFASNSFPVYPYLQSDNYSSNAAK